MPTTTPNRCQKTNPKKATKKEKEENWYATISNVTHEISNRQKREETKHHVSLCFENISNSKKVSMNWSLDSAFQIYQFRTFLGFFDFPLVDDQDIDAACKRILGTFCEIRIKKPDSPRRKAELLQIIRVWGKNPDSKDDQDIWNHDFHWNLSKMEEKYSCCDFHPLS